MVDENEDTWNYQLENERILLRKKMERENECRFQINILSLED